MVSKKYILCLLCKEQSMFTALLRFIYTQKNISLGKNLLQSFVLWFLETKRPFIGGVHKPRSHRKRRSPSTGSGSMTDKGNKRYAWNKSLNSDYHLSACQPQEGGRAPPHTLGSCVWTVTTRFYHQIRPYWCLWTALGSIWWGRCLCRDVPHQCSHGSDI